MHSVEEKKILVVQERLWPFLHSVQKVYVVPILIYSFLGFLPSNLQSLTAKREITAHVLTDLINRADEFLILRKYKFTNKSVLIFALLALLEHTV